jgi:hypothetical protein
MGSRQRRSTSGAATRAATEQLIRGPHNAALSPPQSDHRLLLRAAVDRKQKSRLARAELVRWLGLRGCSSEGRGTFLAKRQASLGRCSDSEVSTCCLCRQGRARRRPRSRFWRFASLSPCRARDLLLRQRVSRSQRGRRDSLCPDSGRAQQQQRHRHRGSFAGRRSRAPGRGRRLLDCRARPAIS